MLKNLKLRNTTGLSAWLLSLTLFFGFLPAVSSEHCQERQAAKTEWLSRPAESVRRSVAYSFWKKKLFTLFWNSKIIHRLKFFDVCIATRIFENHRHTEVIVPVQMKHIAFAYCEGNLQDTPLFRG